MKLMKFSDSFNFEGLKKLSLQNSSAKIAVEVVRMDGWRVLPKNIICLLFQMPYCFSIIYAQYPWCLLLFYVCICWPWMWKGNWLSLQCFIFWYKGTIEMKIIQFDKLNIYRIAAHADGFTSLPIKCLKLFQ